MSKEEGEKAADTVSVHLPMPLIKKLDELKAQGNYTSRSDLIRDIIREWFDLRRRKVGEIEKNFKKK